LPISKTEEAVVMKNKKSKVIFSTLCACFVCLLLTACNGASNKQTSKNGENDQATQIDSNKKVTISAVVWCPDIPEQTQDLINRFMEKYPNITVDMQAMGNSIPETLQPRAASNSLPDFMSLDGDSFAKQLADEGKLADVTNTKAWANTLDSLKTEWTSSKGVHYGISGGLATTLFYYNMDMFKKAGISAPPQDWDSFLEDCAILKKAGMVPMILSGGDPNTLANTFFSYGLAQDVVSKDENYMADIEKGTFDFNTKEMAGVFDKIKLIADKGYCQKGYMSADYNGSTQMFVEGKAAMIFQGTWLAGTLTQTSFPVGTFLPPWNAKGETKVPSVSSETGWAVSNNSANKDAALLLLEFWNGEGYSIYQNPRMCVPHLKESAIQGKVELAPQITTLMAEVATYPKTIPLFFAYLPASTATPIQKAMQEVLLGQKTSAQAAKMLDDLVKEAAK
jgi:multiple sugar transport system substrate-binding protein